MSFLERFGRNKNKVAKPNLTEEAALQVRLDRDTAEYESHGADGAPLPEADTDVLLKKLTGDGKPDDL